MFFSVDLHGTVGTDSFIVVCPAGESKVKEWAQSEVSCYGYKDCEVSILSTSSKLTTAGPETIITLI